MLLTFQQWERGHELSANRAAASPDPQLTDPTRCRPSLLHRPAVRQFVVLPSWMPAVDAANSMSVEAQLPASQFAVPCRSPSGVQPAQSWNALKNEVGSSNPSRNEISPFDSVVCDR